MRSPQSNFVYKFAEYYQKHSFSIQPPNSLEKREFRNVKNIAEELILLRHGKALKKSLAREAGPRGVLIETGRQDTGLEHR